MSINFLIRNVYKNSFAFRFKSPVPAQTLRVNFKTFQAPERHRNSILGITTTSICHIHVTSPRKALPPMVILLFRFMAKATTIISGKIIRKWWRKLSEEEKEKVLAKIRSKKSAAAFVVTVFAGFLSLFYLEHLLEDPLTRRKRFIILNKEQVNKIAEYEYERSYSVYRTLIVPDSHPICRRVVRVANTLLRANSDIPAVKENVWSVTVVDKPDVINMFVLPNGKIFVFTGMLNVCTNDDQLAVVLGHEMSHAILNHLAEMMSQVLLVEFILLFPSLIFWIIFPNVWALFSEWVTKKLANVLIHLPFSRAIEREADVVGLAMAAKACFDVREAVDFWRKMKIIGHDAPIEWLSTHPRHKTRQKEMEDLLPEAMEIRLRSHCPALTFKVRRF